MKYIDADRLRATIEKRINSIESCPFIEAEFGAEEKREGEIQAYNDVLAYLDSLQQEQQEVDIEKEIDACWLNWLSPSNQKEVEGVLPKTEFAMYARHFYELGLNARRKANE